MPPDPIILIVEDNDLSRTLMEGILQGAGYKVVGAADGVAALEVIKDTPIALAYVDLNMEPMGGFEFIKHVREHNALAQDIAVEKYLFPIVIVTADESSDVLMLAQEHGAAQLLKKPVEPELLLKVAEKLL